jgi:hypothetical protein
MGMNLEEMNSLPERESIGSMTVVHVAVVEDEETGIVSRQPIHFCLGTTGKLEATHREDPDFHLGAVGGE